MATVFFIGYVYDWHNEVWVRPKFLFDGVEIEAALGEEFARVDVDPGSPSIEMITEGYTFDGWDALDYGLPLPSFTDPWANPTDIHATSGCWYFAWVYPTPDPFETEYHSSYRGIDIYQYLVSLWYTFTYPDMVYAYETLQECYDTIDERQLVETYLGVDIYQDAASLWYTFTAADMIWLYETLQECYDRIDGLLDPDPEPDEFIETYREYDIYRRPDEGLFYAIMTPEITAIGLTLVDVKESIDYYINLLDPDEDPTGGIFAQVIAAMKKWVEDHITWRLQPVYDWVETLIAGAKLAWEGLVAGAVTLINAVSADLTSLATTVGDRWDEFNTLTLPLVWDTITEAFEAVAPLLDAMWTDIEAAIDTGLQAVGDYIDERLENYAPQGFQSDPVKYVQDHADIRYQLLTEAMIKSFWEGFEEGQKTG